PQSLTFSGHPQQFRSKTISVPQQKKTLNRIIKEHDGDIHAYSEVGKGTVFRVSLPAAPES
ncbi:MAG: hypothetical protein JXA35_06550, partial [Deltaproteobacteria bacterium]|nr:hypothetical protein [Deltaproteobacteria bacterium]